uniref:Uncharacterized protein n=1 Tax=Rhizophora mucronata TaxID=61149 RepID=A0A2P2Q6K2_RHIMU
MCLVWSVRYNMFDNDGYMESTWWIV